MFNTFYFMVINHGGPYYPTLQVVFHILLFCPNHGELAQLKQVNSQCPYISDHYEAYYDIFQKLKNDYIENEIKKGLQCSTAQIILTKEWAWEIYDLKLRLLHLFCRYYTIPQISYISMLFP